jgi:hypothetical protein
MSSPSLQMMSTMGSATIGAKATKDASKQSAMVAMMALMEQQRQYEDQKKMFMPFYKTGTGALEDYQKMLHGGYEMEESPAAQYQLQQGTKAMNRALAARGLSGSGNAVNRLTELNSSIAASDWSNQYNRLLDAIKIGTGAASSAGQAGQNYANAVSNTANNLGNIYQNNANTLGSIYQNAATGINNAMNSAGNNAMGLVSTGIKSGWWGDGGGWTGDLGAGGSLSQFV